MASDPAPILRFDGVTKRFGGRVALDAIDFTLRRGAVTGLIGPDGAGKTTPMRLGAALMVPDAGAVCVDGAGTRTQPDAVKRAVGYMPQRFGLYEDLTVAENLDLHADLQGLEPRIRPARYAELMQMTGLARFTGRLAGKLSGGMKQKLGLACALLRSPRLLLLDEPTVGVDPVSRRELWQIVYRQVEEQGMSVLLSTAYLDEAERCDEVILLHEGRILGHGAPAGFSAPLRRRIYLARARGFSARRAQALLARTPGVLDALVEGEQVRLVLEEGADAGAVVEAAGTEIELAPAEPRFEDAFVARLKRGRASAPAVEMTIEVGGSGDGEVIRVRDLVRRFGDFTAVDRVSFSVRRGEVFGLLGANGAGKSTTFRMLCGLLPPSGGEVSVAGHDLGRAAPAARGRIGYMAQKFSLYGDLSVMQNLTFFSSAYGLRGQRQRERLRWALETFELAPYRDANAADLPLGYKQRLAFAAALMHEPEILFLDEPTSGVDPLARREFWARTNALAEAGVTVLVTTHFMDEANYCDRLVIMADGRVLAQGTPRQMKDLARSEALPEPTMEDAFIHLIERGRREAAA